MDRLRFQINAQDGRRRRHFKRQRLFSILLAATITATTTSSSISLTSRRNVVAEAAAVVQNCDTFIRRHGKHPTLSHQHSMMMMSSLSYDDVLSWLTQLRGGEQRNPHVHNEHDTYSDSNASRNQQQRHPRGPPPPPPVPPLPRSRSPPAQQAHHPNDEVDLTGASTTAAESYSSKTHKPLASPLPTQGENIQVFHSPPPSLDSSSSSYIRYNGEYYYKLSSPPPQSQGQTQRPHPPPPPPPLSMMDSDPPPYARQRTNIINNNHPPEQLQRHHLHNDDDNDNPHHHNHLLRYHQQYHQEGGGQHHHYQEHHNVPTWNAQLQHSRFHHDDVNTARIFEQQQQHQHDQQQHWPPQQQQQQQQQYEYDQQFWNEDNNPTTRHYYSPADSHETSSRSSSSSNTATSRRIMPSGGGQGGYSNDGGRNHAASWAIDEDNYNQNQDNDDTIDLDAMEEVIVDDVGHDHDDIIDGTVLGHDEQDDEQQPQPQQQHQQQQQGGLLHSDRSLDDDCVDDDNNMESYTPLHHTVALFNLVQASIERLRRLERQHQPLQHKNVVNDSSLQSTVNAIYSNIGLLLMKRSVILSNEIFSSALLVAKANTMQGTFLTTAILEPVKYRTALAAAAAARLEKKKKLATTTSRKQRRHVYRETYLSRIQDFERDLEDEELESLLLDMTANPVVEEIVVEEEHDEMDEHNDDYILDEDGSESVPTTWFEKIESLQAFQWNSQENKHHSSGKDDEEDVDEELNDYELELLNDARTGLDVNWREDAAEDVDEDSDFD